jgi:hypothetical protein
VSREWGFQVGGDASGTSWKDIGRKFDYPKERRARTIRAHRSSAKGGRFAARCIRQDRSA